MHSKLLFGKTSADSSVKLRKFLSFVIFSLDPGALIVMSCYVSPNYSGQHDYIQCKNFLFKGFRHYFLAKFGIFCK